MNVAIIGVEKGLVKLECDHKTGMMILAHLQSAVKYFEGCTDGPGPSTVAVRVIATELGNQIAHHWPDMLFLVQNGWNEDKEFSAWVEQIVEMMPDFYRSVSPNEARDLYLMDYSPEQAAEALPKIVQERRAKKTKGR